jgi:hypothetical protein
VPTVEPILARGDRFELRHVGPLSSVWPTSPNAPVTVLARTDMISRPLPMSQLPGSPDFVSGTWNGRLGDAGDATLVFPNGPAGDGIPYRTRFDATGHLQWVEILDNGETDFVGVIDKVTVDQQKVTLHLSDGWFLLKKAYERDWVVTQAPRDVIERGTQVWVPAVVDNFPAGSLNAQWTTSVTGTGATISVANGGGLLMTTPAVSGAYVVTATATKATGSTQTWRASADLQYVNVPTGTDGFISVEENTNGDTYGVFLYGGKATFQLGSNAVAQIVPATTPSYRLTLESDGEWVSAFCNGQLVGTIRRAHAASESSFSLQLGLASLLTSQASTALFQSCLFESLQPFLQRGADKGDHVLPGDATTYPSGGLHARYFNDLDLQADPNRLLKIHAPSRTQAYAGSGTSEYANQQDATISGQANPTPGAAQTNWSCVWFGAVYLKLSQGNYTFTITGGSGAQVAFRLWLGKTKFGDQIIDKWDFTGMSPSNSVTVTAASLAGSLPYGGGTVARDGWYPIKLEYAVDSQLNTAVGLDFTPPASYTDPGGTALTGGTSVVIPSTSLSPLGCVDQRYQGVSHFDLVQQTMQAYAYQASVEPQTLESGLFPGVLAPRIREGHDTDITLQPDRTSRQDGEGLLNYSSTSDATDFAASLQGNGAGFQNGTAGQLQALVYDPPTLKDSLFDAQGWQDSSDASFVSLLQALLNAQLGLRLSPWELLSADPNGQPRLAYTWPLPGTLAAMRWRPGDGVRIQARDINVWDTSPRQMLVITRNILPNGKASTQASFANRPRTPAHTLKQQLYAATRWQRNYQRQLVTLNGNYQAQAIAAGNGALSPQYSGVLLSPGDQVVRARLRIFFINGTSPTIGVVVWTTSGWSDVTNTLSGPWSVTPINLDVTSVLAISLDNRALVDIVNKSANAIAEVNFQLSVDVLR